MPGAWTCIMGKKTKQMNKKRRDIFNIRQISVGLISTSREILTARQDLYTITYTLPQENMRYYYGGA